MGAKLDGGGGGKRGTLPINSEPNVIPFIDIMLVLLIIFMVASPIAAVDIRSDMPDSSEIISSKRPNKPTWVTLVDGEDCRQLVKGQPVATCPAWYVMEDAVGIEELGVKTLDALKVNNPKFADDLDRLREERVYVRATAGTKYSNVMRVMNRLQDQGITKIALVADDKNL
jgi:biopolymer transport protein ExbD